MMRSISLKYSIPVILLLSSSVMGLGAFQQEVATAYDRAEQELRHQANFTGNQTAQLIEYLHQQSLGNDVSLWFSQLSTAPHVNMALLLDDRNQITNSTRLALQNQSLLDLIQQNALAVGVEQIQQVRQTQAGRVVLSSDGNRIVAIYPVGLDQNAGRLLSSRVGILLIEYHLAELKQQVYYSAVQRSLIYIVCLMGTGMLLWCCFSRLVVNPLRRLTAASSQISQGNLAIQVEVNSANEIGILARSFNQMVQQLHESFLALAATNAELEQRIADRTAALAAANQELLRLAHVDGLTQLANRRRFDTFLQQEWQRLQRQQQPLSLILCDVDFFKRYNDFYGHQAGDDCLKQVATALNQATRRPTDLVARYGGEEFAVILADTPLDGALIVAELLRQAVQDLNLPHRSSETSNRVTLSLGVASLIPNSNQPPEALIVAADTALYEAKQRGRNRVVAYGYPAVASVEAS